MHIFPKRTVIQNALRIAANPRATDTATQRRWSWMILKSARGHTVTQRQLHLSAVN